MVENSEDYIIQKLGVLQSIYHKEIEFKIISFNSRIRGSTINKEFGHYAGFVARVNTKN